MNSTIIDTKTAQVQPRLAWSKMKPTMEGDFFVRNLTNNPENMTGQLVHVFSKYGKLWVRRLRGSAHSAPLSAFYATCEWAKPNKD